ncbi:SDR family NAD(P)-dependent oxidoreductase, partial [Nocardia nova]|nr:SDR family NAD(P)-dependent oxidoreductase [Nocardia nova]
GEVAAGCVAGVLSLAEGARIVAVRSRLLVGVAGSGGMVAVGAGEGVVSGWLSGGVGLAAVNGPESVVVSGPVGELRAFVERCAGAGVSVRWLPVDYASHSAAMEGVRTELVAALTDIRPRAGHMDFYSSVTGERIDGTLLDAEYWFRNLRSTVRFEDAARGMLAHGCTTFVEVSPHPVLLAAIQETFDSITDEVVRERGLVTVPSLRRDDGSWRQLLGNAATAWSSGLPVDWRTLFEGMGAARVPLPTYPFQHERYWLDAAATAPGLDTAGIRAADHPMLAAVVHSPEHGGIRLTGRLSATNPAWTRDHLVFGRTLLPGTAVVELAIRAGDETGFPVVDELTLVAPLLLDTGAVDVHVAVGAEETPGYRPVRVYSRAAGADSGTWQVHAEGRLARNHTVAVPRADEPWPPHADLVPLDNPYDSLRDRGYGYGPHFTGLRRVWRRDDHRYAEAELPEGTDSTGYGIHPALLDAALHAILVTDAAADRTSLPYRWSSAILHATGATRVRAVLIGTGDTYDVRLTDLAGQPVFSGTLETRSATAEHLRTDRTDALPLYELGWIPLELADADPMTTAEWGSHDNQQAAPDIVLLRCTPSGSDPAENARAATTTVLAALQSWLDDPRFEHARLLVTTSNAVDVTGGEPTDPASSAVWGLVHAAQFEHPNRIVLLDSPTDLPPARLTAITESAEPEVAVRHGHTWVPRLHAIPATIPAPAAAPLPDPARTPISEPAFPAAPWGGTVLITGGTGGLAAIVARHLVRRYGVQQLVLLSRRGAEAPGARELVEELSGLGAAVEIVGCDVTDRGALARVVEPLRLAAVVHLAGVLDDGVVQALTAQRLAEVLAPKVDGAWHLHELTADKELSAFVVFSSTAGVLGGAGQANYAAANRFLDGLVAYRRSQGLAGVAVAWGLWDETTAMTAHLSGAEGRGSAIGGLSTGQALRLLDDALAADAPLTVAACLDTVALRAQAAEGTLPPVFSALVPRRRTAAAGAPATNLRDRLRDLDAEQRFETVLGICRSEAAAVLGHSGPAAVDASRAFRDLGFDSLAAVRFRNGLGAATGVALPSTLVFDHPTPRALTRYLLTELTGDESPAPRRSPVAARADEPLAVVGMGCRFPGGVASPEDLWHLVAEGRDVVTDFPADRGWDIERLYDPQPGVAGKSSTRFGGFLDGVAEFDAAFFGIGPREAVETDPQQRLLLEVTWEALESAGIDPKSLHGSDTGVFTGLMYHDYPAGDGKGSIASGRVSYVLGLEGPAVTVDTACSSSLVALHQAGLSLRAGECS